MYAELVQWQSTRSGDKKLRDNKNDIEAGSRTIKARHVLQRAATEHNDEYKEIMKKSLENA